MRYLDKQTGRKSAIDTLGRTLCRESLDIAPARGAFSETNPFFSSKRSRQKRPAKITDMSVHALESSKAEYKIMMWWVRAGRTCPLHGPSNSQKRNWLQPHQLCMSG